MTSWADLGIVSDNLVTYLFGSYVVFAIVMTLIFLMVLLAVGMELKYALPLSLPIIGLFGLSGWLGGSPIVNGILIVAAILYAFSIVKIFGGR